MAVQNLNHTLLSNRGYIVAGRSESNNGDVNGNNGSADYWILKLDDTGNLEWEKNYGGSELDEAFSIQQTTDGGFIVAGRSRSNDGDTGNNNGNRDYWILKLDLAGNLEWERNYGGSGLDIANYIQQTTDGGYILVGGSESSDGDVGGNNGAQDYWILKLDMEGNLQWEKNYGGSAEDSADVVHQTVDGGYIVSGYSFSSNGDVSENNGESDYWILKLDMEGNLEWERNYGGSEIDIAGTIQQTMDEGFIISGYSRSNDGDVGGNNGGLDYWILKLDLEGNLEWEQNYGGSASDIGTNIQQTMDEGFIVSGYSGSNDGDVGGNNGGLDYWILKLDIEGNLEWEQNYGGSAWESATIICQTMDEGYIIAGGSESNDGDVVGNMGERDFWIIKLAGPPVGIQKTNSSPDITIFPNPSKGNFIIRVNELVGPFNVKIIDVLGRNIYNKSEIYESLKVDFIPKGQYYINLTSGKNSYFKKVIIQ